MNIPAQESTPKALRVCALVLAIANSIVFIPASLAVWLGIRLVYPGILFLVGVSILIGYWRRALADRGLRAAHSTFMYGFVFNLLLTLATITAAFRPQGAFDRGGIVILGYLVASVMVHGWAIGVARRTMRTSRDAMR